ncbi:MAG: SDR family NAD(P)-dependent oxidoreductase [Sphaerochaetaceae bacterium]|nr:SDR family NAD(P)-dependent oxidoreductase [Sphaerochaetaceae bacterium]
MKRSERGDVLVTGATSGIGRAVSELLADEGYTIFGVSRSAGPGSFHHDRIISCRMDVTDALSIEQAIEEISRKRGMQPLRAVIHCAGYGIAGSTLDTPMDAIRSQFETNYFGLLTVNEILMKKGLLRGSRIVILGSVAGRISIPYQSHYSASKFALEAYTEALRLEGSHLGITATIIEAGDTKTSFSAARTYHAPPGSLLEARGRKAVERMEKDEQKGHDPSVVAKVVLRALKRTRLPVRMPVGLSYTILLLLRRIFPDALVEAIVRRLYLS